MKWFQRIVGSKKTRAPGRTQDRRLGVEELEQRVTPSTLLPVSGQDLVYDAARHILYLVNGARVERYDVAAQTALSPYQLGTTLTAADITPDNNTLYVTSAPLNPTTGVVHRINLATGAISNLTYPLAATEGAGGKIAVANNGRAFFAGNYSLEDPVPFREIDLVSHAITLRTDVPRPGVAGTARATHVFRSGNHGLLFIGETSPFQGGIFTYDAVTNSFSAPFRVSFFNNYTPVVLNRDGTRIAVRTTFDPAVMDRNLNTVEVPGNDLVGGMVFDPVRDIYYAINHLQDQVVAFDTNTWREKFRLAVGEDVTDAQILGPGNMTMSSDGRFLFLVTNSGVRRIDLPNDPGVARSLEAGDFPAFTGQSTTNPFTVRILDSFGDPVVNYTGTLRFTSTDAGATLPADYTFTLADRGVKTFTAAFATLGTHALTVRDTVTSALSATQGGITIHNNLVTQIPVINHRNLIHDPARGMVYLTMGNGTLNRYDLARQTLLAPWRVGRSLGTADISPDGRFLYVGESAGGLLSGLMRKVDLDTGQVTNLSLAGTVYSSAVVITNNGKALFIGRNPLFGIVGVHVLDLTTGASMSRYAFSGHMLRSADRSRVFLVSLSLPGNPSLIYDAATDTFPRSVALGTSGVGTVRDAVNRNGTLIVSSATFDQNLNPTLPHLRVGSTLAFNPVRDIFYSVSPDTDQIIALSTTTGNELYRINNSPGSLAFNSYLFANVSGDGQLMFLSTHQGIRIVNIPSNPGVVAALELMGYPTYTGQGVSNSFTVRVIDNLANPVTNYTGTVQFSSTDPTATLPAAYTFTPADQGVRTFTATFNRVGGFTLTARDASQPALTSGPVSVSIHDNQNISLSIPSPRDLVYDPTRQMLYVTSGTGRVYRYDVARRTLLPSVLVGFDTYGTDITTDGNFLYVPDSFRAPTQGMIRRLNVADDSVSTLFFPLEPQELFGPRAFVIASNNKALFPTNLSGVGAPGLRELNLATGTFTTRQSTPPNTSSRRGQDRNLLLFWAHSSFVNTVSTYDAVTDSFPPPPGGGGRTGSLGAVSRDSALVALQTPQGISIGDRNLNPVRFLSGIDGGLVFDPIRDTLYAINSATDQVIAYNTNTWAERFRISARSITDPAVPFVNGMMAVSSDGRHLFLTTVNGVRVLELPPTTDGLAGFEVRGFPRYTGAGTPQSFTVRAFNGQGETLTDYTGTVWFSAAGTGVVLPPDYTFTPTDQGVRTFTAVFNVPGPRGITVRDTDQPSISGTQSGITIHNGQGSMIPVTNQRDLAYDPVRNILYLATNSGSVERYHVPTRTLLPPIDLGSAQSALDVSPDGNLLFVALTQPAPFQGQIVRVNLTTGAIAHFASSVNGSASDLTYLAAARLLFASDNKVYLMHPITGDFIERRTLRPTLRIQRSFDRGLAFLGESSPFTDNHIHTYEPVEDVFPRSLRVDIDTVQPLVNRNGTLVGHKRFSTLQVRDSNFTLVREFAPPLDGGAVFDPLLDQLYLVNSTTNQVVVLDTFTWGERYRVDIGGDVAAAGGFIGLTAISGDGQFLFLTSSDGVRVIRINGPPRVMHSTPTSTGFTTLFSRAVDSSVLNLYDTQTGGLGLTDLTLTGATTGPVSGSLVISPTGTQMTFVRTGGPLPPDTYTLILRSAGNGFRDPVGSLLDGDADGLEGGDFVQVFSVAPSSAVVVSIPDFMRGPDQPVNVPPGSLGLPLHLISAGGVTSVRVTLRYDPALLAVTAASVVPGLPTGTQVIFTPGGPGVSQIDLNSPGPLPAGSIEFVRLTATVPRTAGYARKQVLNLDAIQINGGALLPLDDDGVQLVGYWGDTTRNGGYSASDALRTLRVAVGFDRGFAPYPLADPVLIADVNTSGAVNSTDATRLLQEALGIDAPEIPPLPPNPPTIPVSGPDPLLNLPRRLRGRPGNLVTVPVNLDRSAGLDAADLALSYDPRQLEVVSVQRGSLTSDFDLLAVNHDAEEGTLRVGLGRSAGPITSRGRGSVLLITFRIKPDASAGQTIINLRQSVGTTLTQLNEGGLDLYPDPSNEAGDGLDGAVLIRGRSARQTATLARDLAFATWRSTELAELELPSLGKRRPRP